MKTISIILTIHNKQALVRAVTTNILQRISKHAKELIVIFDGCTDLSELAFDCAAKGAKIAVKKLHADNVFETKANNLGLKASNCDYSCIIQDDMVMKENDFDARLLKAALLFPDCFAISGRDAHNIKVESPTTVSYPDIVGWTTGAARDMVFVGDVVNRGPLLLENDRLRQLDYFDEAFCPQNQDDHDLCLRAREKGWRCGACVLDYLSPAEWGSSRKGAGAGVITKAIAKNMVLNRHGEFLKQPKTNEERPFG